MDEDRDRRPAKGAPRVLLVFPRFNPHSFWSFKETCELVGVKCAAPPLGLLTLAALLPAPWQLRLIDRNAQELTPADIAAADLVMTGGMLPQQRDTLDVMAMCRAEGRPVCVGGPDPTSNPEIYADADFLVLGEAEGIIGEFVAAWDEGRRSGRFEAKKFQVDVAKSPMPRFDLIEFGNYLYVGVQFSRGCPFTCEFCDIIELYGRVPRTKTPAQMLAELDRIHALGYRGHVDFVDDNLIGNKKAIKKFLPELKKWQEAHGYPFKFSTEASLNLADDAELLQMMRDTNFVLVFTGIESPDEATLVAMRKKQNTRRSIADSVARIYGAGMFVMAGFIVGFDTEGEGTADAMAGCIDATSIPVAMVGLLHALPNTQLVRRLEREGRLFDGYNRVAEDAGDQCTAGLNFVTQRSRRDILADYRTVLTQAYEPAAFFRRVRTLGRMLRRPSFGAGGGGLRLSRHELATLRQMCWRMTVRHPRLARHFWPALIECIRRNPDALESVVTNMTFYLHLYPFSRHVIRELDRRIAEIDAGRWTPPAVLPPPALVPAQLARA